MRILFGVIGAAGVVITIFYFLQSSSARPIVSFDSDIVDLGYVLPSTSVNLTTTIANSGDHNLILSDLRSSCGCTKPSIDRSTLHPGEHAQLSATVRTPNHMGEFSHAIFLKTNDPVLPEIRVAFKGYSRWPIASNKSVVYMTGAAGQSCHPAEVDLFSTTNESFDIQEIVTTAEWLNVQIVGNSPTTKRLLLSATAPQSGKFSENINIHTNNSLRPTILIQVVLSAGVKAMADPGALVLNKRLPQSVVNDLKIGFLRPQNTDTIRLIEVLDSHWAIQSSSIEYDDDVANVYFSIRLPATRGHQRTFVKAYWETNETPSVVPVSCVIE